VRKRGTWLINFVLQEAQKKLEQSSDAHKSILLNLSQLAVQTDAVSKNHHALALWMQSAKIQCMQVPQLRDEIDQLNAKEKFLHGSIQKFQEKLAHIFGEKECLLEAQKAWHSEKISMQSRIFELSTSNADLIQLEDKYRSKLRRAAAGMRESAYTFKT
jgi:chromosome segregation ATPase